MSERSFALLCIDPAATSGWARLVGSAIDSGTTDDSVGRANCVINAALSTVIHVDDDVRRCPLIIVHETWTPHGMGHASVFGLGAQWGRWMQEIERVERWKVGRSLYPKVVGVPVNTWRRMLFGRTNFDSERFKRMACDRASHFAGPRIVDHNEAEALCLLEYARKAPEVLALLPRAVAA